MACAEWASFEVTRGGSLKPRYEFDPCAFEWREQSTNSRYATNRAAALARSLPNQAELAYSNALADSLDQLPGTLRGTEVERMVRQRVGQQALRNAMLDYWGSACAVTGLKVTEALRASHAKPWAECDSDAERLDVFNGFLLSANLDALFSLPHPPDAFLTAADRLALGYYAGLKKRNVRIPAEVAFVGFSNLNVAELLNPPMSTVVQPAFQMGHKAAGLLLDLVEKKPKQPVFGTVRLSTELFVRESSLPA